MIQIQNLIPLFTYVMAPASIAIAIMFLPAIIELKKPHDAGPRIINYGFTQLSSLCLGMLVDIEEKIENQLHFRTAVLPSFISNIET